MGQNDIETPTTHTIFALIIHRQFCLIVLHFGAREKMNTEELFSPSCMVCYDRCHLLKIGTFLIGLKSLLYCFFEMQLESRNSVSSTGS